MRSAVPITAGYAVVALLFMLLRTRAHGSKPKYAVPSGSERAGVMYAFFKGMLPSEKESVRKHLPTFFAGILYHFGILCALTLLALELAIPTVDLSGSPILTLRLGLVAGFVSGVALLVKRISFRKMRLISTADDFIANLLVDLFIGLALIHQFSMNTEIAYVVVANLLFLYIPLGKIRHCAYFFCTRTIFGKLLGRRGVLPHPAPEKVTGA
jgi:hypothetical protein